MMDTDGHFRIGRFALAAEGNEDSYGETKNAPSGGYDYVDK